MKIATSIFFLLISIQSLEAKWSCFSDYDKMDNIRVYGCSSKDISGHRTLIGKPSLFIRTSNDELEIYISAQEYIGNVSEIEVKFGTSPKTTYTVSTSTDNVAMFLDDPISFMSNIKKNNKVLIRYIPYNESPVTIEFDIKGFTSSNKNLTKIIDRLLIKENQRLATIEENRKREEEQERIHTEEEQKKLQEEHAHFDELKNNFASNLEKLKQEGNLNWYECENITGHWRWNSESIQWQCDQE